MERLGDPDARESWLLSGYTYWRYHRDGKVVKVLIANSRERVVNIRLEHVHFLEILEAEYDKFLQNRSK